MPTSTKLCLFSFKHRATEEGKNMEESGNRAEAERWLGIAGKLLIARDLIGCKRFAVRAQERDPLLDGVDQILAVADVLLAAEKRVNNHMDWYAILQLDSRSNDLELMKRQYRRLALLLHPDKNKSVFADNAFKLVSDAWVVLSDPSKKALYDNELSLFLKFDPISLSNQQSQEQQQQPLVRRSTREKRKTTKATEFSSSRNEPRVSSRLSSFWTACPYCYNLYEYPRVYEDCCLRCQNCRRAFHAAVVPSPPPVVPGKDAYYCCWAFFPIGFSMPDSGSGKNSGLPNWVPFTSFTSMSPFPTQQGEMANPTVSKTSSDNKDGLMDVSDESWDSRARKKGKTVNDKKSKNPKSSQSVKLKKGNENLSQQAHSANESLQQGSVMPDVAKTQRKTKKTARKTSGRVLNNKTIGGRSNIEWIDMDLNVEVKAEGEEPESAVGEEEEVGNIDEDATEGIGFFEGLDDILGNLPILSVPEDQKVESEAMI